jgi:hypothetical protein
LGLCSGFESIDREEKGVDCRASQSACEQCARKGRRRCRGEVHSWWQMGEQDKRDAKSWSPKQRHGPASFCLLLLLPLPRSNSPRMSAQFVGHHATGAHTADSPRHHSFTSSVSSLFNHDRDPTLTDEQEGDDVFPDRRVHRSDLVEERPEEDLPESAYRVVPAVSDGTREVAAGQQALKPVPSLDISDSTLSLGCEPSERNGLGARADLCLRLFPCQPRISSSISARTSSQLRFQSAGKKITVARILTNQGDWQGAIRPPGIDPRRVDMVSVQREEDTGCSAHTSLSFVQPDLKANCVIQAVDCSKAVSVVVS